MDTLTLKYLAGGIAVLMVIILIVGLSTGGIDKATKVSDEIIVNEPVERHVYGLGFWCNDQSQVWPDLPAGSFAASGAGNQHIWVCPSLDLVVVQ